MTSYLSIKQALKLLTLMRSQRLTKKERDSVNTAIIELKRACVDPGYRASLNVEVGDK